MTLNMDRYQLSFDQRIVPEIWGRHVDPEVRRLLLHKDAKKCYKSQNGVTKLILGVGHPKVLILGGAHLKYMAAVTTFDGTAKADSILLTLCSPNSGTRSAAVLH